LQVGKRPVLVDLLVDKRAFRIDGGIVIWGNIDWDLIPIFLPWEDRSYKDKVQAMKEIDL
jgi:hypothetical protein